MQIQMVHRLKLLFPTFFLIFHLLKYVHDKENEGKWNEILHVFSPYFKKEKHIFKSTCKYFELFCELDFVGVWIQIKPSL